MAEFVVYCPRCDKKFVDKRSKKEAKITMEAHVRRAHPDYEWEGTDL